VANDLRPVTVEEVDLASIAEPVSKAAADAALLRIKDLRCMAGLFDLFKITHSLNISHARFPLICIFAYAGFFQQP
jgi:hypothetical protein